MSLAPTEPISTHAFHFRDAAGRAVLFRGINFTSSSKAPVTHPSYRTKDYWSDAEAGKAEYINSVLNLEDGTADEHLARLRSYGFNFLRFVFTWEAIEHEGPGKYDEGYMEYVIKVLRKVGEWGFRVFMDPHQDVWSRFSGGSGAPIWTLYACGLDPQLISVTYSALLHHEWPSPSDPQPSKFPSMIWSTNYSRLASLTLFTMFFAGRAYAPKCIIDGQNIQDWLQDRYISSCVKLAERIRDAGDLADTIVVGWDSMNEPGDGMIGRENVGEIPKEQQLKLGPMPTPWESMRMGMGEKIEVDNWEFTAMGPSKSGRVVLDPKGAKVWLKPEEEETRGGGKWGWKRDEGWKLGECIWAQHGVWDPTSSPSRLLKADYFRAPPSSSSSSAPRASFETDFWLPHWLAFASAIRAVHPRAILLVQPSVFAVPPLIPESMLQGRAAFSPHYYDGLTLMTRHWNWFNADALGVLRGKYWNVVQAVKVGERAIRQSLRDQLGTFKEDVKNRIGEYPVVMGEIGIPYDMDDRRAYGYTEGGKYRGDYSSQQKALDASLNGTDGPNCLNYTMWTYNPSNSHQYGDGWNREDLSIWSPDDLPSGTELESAKHTHSTKHRHFRHHDKSASHPQAGAAGAVSNAAEEHERQDQGPAEEKARAKASNPSEESGRNTPIKSSSTGTASSVTLAAPISTTDQASLKSRPTDQENQIKGAPPTPFSPRSVHSGSGITPSLLLDGARAVGAFCRPFPVATAGTPLRIDFDIHSTEFKLQVHVGPEDKVVAEEKGTEVYLPFVHYARTLGAGTSAFLSEARSDSDHQHLRHRHGHGHAHKSEALPTAGNASTIGLLDPSSAAPTRPSSIVPESESRSTEALVLDVEVHVSHGSYTLEGQYLTWTYPVPSTAARNGQTYTLEVKRRGGKLNRPDEAGPDGVQQSRGVVGGMAEVCSNFCEGCVIA